MKTKGRTRLGSKNLEAMLQIVLEGPDEGVDDILGDDVPLWKNDIYISFLYAKSLFLI